jgi:uncharacterized membrane protein
VTAPLVQPSVDDPVVAGAVEAIGGRPGRHARLRPRRFWTVLRVLLALTAFTSLLGFAQKAPCRSGSSWVHEYQYTRACYTDVVALYSAEGLSDGKTPYYEHPVEYPVVIGGVMQVSAQLASFLGSWWPDSAADDARDRLAQATTPEARKAAQDSISYHQAITRGRHFYDVTWALVTLCAMVVVVTLAKVAGRRPWDAALFALSPALLLHATTNWDLIAMAFAGLAMLAWARKRPVLAGVLLGLGAATKLYPILFLVPLLGLCLRAGKLRQWGGLAAAAVLTAIGLTLPFYLTAPSYFDTDSGPQKAPHSSPLDRGSLSPLHCSITQDGVTRLESGRCSSTPVDGVTRVQQTNAVYRFFDLNQTRGADWDSLYLQVLDGRSWFHSDWLSKKLSSSGKPVPASLNHVVEALTLVVLLLVLVLTLAAPRRPRVPQVLFLALAGFLLVNKVDSPQYVLWLVPLAVLARPRWRLFLAWQITEALVLFSRFYFFINNDAVNAQRAAEGIGIRWFFAAVLLRDLLVAIYCGFVIRDMFRPEHDVVRRDDEDDPAGGVLDRAPDARSLQLA